MTAPEQRLYNNALVLAHILRTGQSIKADSQEARKLIIAADAASTANSLTLQNAASTATSNL